VAPKSRPAGRMMSGIHRRLPQGARSATAPPPACRLDPGRPIPLGRRWLGPFSGEQRAAGGNTGVVRGE
jgi:hypothetical protein